VAKSLPTTRADLLLACLLVALAGAFWAPWLVRGDVPLPGDQQTHMLPWSAARMPVARPVQWQAWWWDGVAQFYPWRVQLQRWLSRGEWPLWSTQQFCGYPFVGNGQSAMFYPPNWLYGLLPTSLALPLLLGAHHALCSLLTFAFGRTLGLGAAAAMLSAIAFTYGGPMIGLTPLPTMVNSATWLAGCLLGIELILRRRGKAPSLRPQGPDPARVAGVWLLGVSASMSILAGHLQIGAYVLLTAIVYGAARLIYAARLKQASAVGWLALGGTIGALVAGAQLLPSTELAGMSPRGGVVAGEAAFRGHQQWALKPAELITLALPEALGHPATGDYPLFSYGERCAYVGGVTLLLALVGLGVSRWRWRWAFAGAACIALWGAMGGFPAWVLFSAVPKVGLAGGFVRLLFVYTFFASILGGVGLEALAGPLARASGALRLGARLMAPTAIVLLCVELFTWGWKTIPAADAERLYAPTRLTDYLQQRWEPGSRVLAVTRREDWRLLSRPQALMPPNSATAYEHMESIQGYDSLYPITCLRLAKAISGSDAPMPAANGNMLLLGPRRDSQMLLASGCRWILVADRDSYEPPPDCYGLVATIDGVRVYERSGARPGAFLVPQGDVGRPFADRIVSSVALPTQRPSCNRAQLEVPSSGGEPVDLVLSVAYYPGWRAWADGREAPVGPYADVLQSIRLPHGHGCHVWLAYVPSAVVVGLFTLLLGVAVLAGLAAYHLSGRRGDRHRRPV